jgi:hypothetical protein
MWKTRTGGVGAEVEVVVDDWPPGNTLVALDVFEGLLVVRSVQELCKITRTFASTAASSIMVTSMRGSFKIREKCIKTHTY